VAEVSLVPASFDRERHLPLLLEADDAEEHIRGYLDGGELLEVHGADGMIGVVVLVREADEIEIWTTPRSTYVATSTAGSSSRSTAPTG